MDLPLVQTLLLCAFIFLAGFVDSIAGGGGLISLPAYLAAGLSPHAALATNKFSSTLGTLAAVARYGKAGAIRLRIALAGAAGALAGSAAGARLALALSPDAIHAGVLVLVPAALLVLLFQRRFLPAGGAAAAAGGAEAEVRAGRPGAAWKAAAVGAAIGVYDGAFGPGTGTFLTLAFAVVLGLDLLNAAGCARLVNLASNVGAVVVFLADGRVLFPLAAWTAAAGVAGNWLGARQALLKGRKIIQPLMVVVMVLLLAEVVRRRYFT
jgi:uncharacterized membrane protein YfcA